MRIRTWEQTQKQRKAEATIVLEKARMMQFAEKDAKLQLEAKAERDNFLRIVEKQKQQEEEERLQNEARVQTLYRHKYSLSQQIDRSTQVRQQEKAFHLEESKRVAAALEEQRENIRRVKLAKLASIVELEVEDRYKTGLVNKKISF